MQVITSSQIEQLHIPTTEAIGWVREAFMMKHRCQLPAKISLHPQGSDFINTMPCLLPPEYHLFGCKVVSRIKGTTPALKSDMLLVDSLTGQTLTVVNSDWITAMRTGAVAALAINTLRRSDARVYSFVGLGVIGRATLRCLVESNTDRPLTIRLMAYKDHAEKTAAMLAAYPHVAVETAHSMEQLVDGADVVVSCITDAQGLMVDDAARFKPGVLLVPVHTRGFQNCDTVFDKVFADDTDHVRGFRYFNEFRSFGELSDVLSGHIPGRESDSERIISYNIGIGLHDVLFASKILQKISNSSNSQYYG